MVLERAEGTTGRVGITVSKRVGGAVVRNRIRRWVREYSRHRPEFPGPGRDVVVIAKRTAATLGSYWAVEADLESVSGKVLA